MWNMLREGRIEDESDREKERAVETEARISQKEWRDRRMGWEDAA
jgi:hypothetical protein